VNMLQRHFTAKSNREAVSAYSARILTFSFIFVLIATGMFSIISYHLQFKAYAQLSGQSVNNNFDQRTEFEGRRLLDNNTASLILYGIDAAMVVATGYAVAKIAIILTRPTRSSPPSPSKRNSPYASGKK